MPEILHRIVIPSDPQTVYSRIAEADGIKQWWTQDAAGGQSEGDILELGFNGRKVVLRLRVDELQMSRRIIWTCTENVGGMDEWPGTQLVWNLAPWKSADTDLRLTHGNWRTVAGEFPACNTLWGQLLMRLKFAAMGRPQGALFY